MSMSKTEQALADLITEYAAWQTANDLDLGSADDHLFDETLTDEQRAWLFAFCQRWTAAERATQDAILKDVFANGGPPRAVKPRDPNADGTAVVVYANGDVEAVGRFEPLVSANGGRPCPALEAEQRRIIKTWSK
jgi:hypothetical protein